MGTEVRAARPDEMDVVADLLALVFKGGRKWFYNIITQDPWRDPANTLLALVDDRIVAHVQVHKRPVHYGRSRLIIGGIGHVATHPDFRGRGLSTALLNRAIERMEQGGYHLSLLYTGINEFYARLGWRTIPIDELSGLLPAAPPAGSGGYGIEHARIPAEMPEAPRVYNAWAPGWIGPLDRTEEYWQRNPSWTDDEFIAEDHGATTRAVRDGRTCGYLRGRIANLPPSRCAIDELCYLPGEEACVADLLQRFIASAIAAGKERVHLECGDDHPAAKLLAGVTSLTAGRDTSAMFRIIDPACLINAAGEELKTRLTAADRLGGQPLTVDCEAGRIAVHLDDPVTAEPTSSPADVEMPLEAFLQLVLGRQEASDLAARGALEWTGTERWEDLRALLPERPYYYSRFDKF